MVILLFSKMVQKIFFKLMKQKLIRITTVPISLKYLIKGQMRFMSKNGFDVTMISAGGGEIKEVIKNEECKDL